MESRNILVPTDFTKAAEKAIEHAVAIASNSGDGITLLHIVNSHTEQLLEAAGKEPDELNSMLEETCQQVSQQVEAGCSYRTEEGNILEDINKVALDKDFRLMVIGTHGTRGLRQNLFGADMLKIARKAPVPIIIVPEENAHLNYETIVFPFGGHPGFRNKIKATADIAQLFGSEVHIYSVDRPYSEISEQIKTNIESAKATFKERNIRFKEVHEGPEVYSAGFAKQTINYANKVNAGLIAVMSVATEEFSYISESDKEGLVNNDHGIAILMTSDFHASANH